MDKYFWYCNACGAQNSREDGECQFCECAGVACRRDSCSDPRHFPENCSGCGAPHNDADRPPHGLCAACLGD